MTPRAAYRFSSAGSRPTSSRWPRSAPEQKVPPAPLMTAAPTCWSRSASSQAATNSPASSLFRAFLVAGAFRVMNATPSVISRSIMGWLLGWIAMGGLTQAFGDHRDRGRHHGRDHVGRRVQQHPGPPAVRPGGQALADEPGRVGRVGQARPDAGRPDVLHPVQPEAPPLALVQVVRYQVPAAAGVDQAVRLDVAAAVLPGTVG